MLCGIPINLSVGTNSGGLCFQIKQGHLIWKTLKMTRVVEFKEGTLVYLCGVCLYGCTTKTLALIQVCKYVTCATYSHRRMLFGSEPIYLISPTMWMGDLGAANAPNMRFRSKSLISWSAVSFLATQCSTLHASTASGKMHMFQQLNGTAKCWKLCCNILLQKFCEITLNLTLWSGQ